MLGCRRPWCSASVTADSTASLEGRNLVITSAGQVSTRWKNWANCSCEGPCCWTVCVQVKTQSLCLFSSGMYIICIYISDNTFHQSTVESLHLGFQTFVLTHFNSVENLLWPVWMIWDDETTWLVIFDTRRRKYHWAQENIMRSFIICTPVHSEKIINSSRLQWTEHVTHMGRRQMNTLFL